MFSSSWNNSVIKRFYHQTSTTGKNDVLTFEQKLLSLLLNKVCVGGESVLPEHIVCVLLTRYQTWSLTSRETTDYLNWVSLGFRCGWPGFCRLPLSVQTPENKHIQHLLHHNWSISRTNTSQHFHIILMCPVFTVCSRRKSKWETDVSMRNSSTDSWVLTF